MGKQFRRAEDRRDRQSNGNDERQGGNENARARVRQPPVTLALFRHVKSLKTREIKTRYLDSICYSPRQCLVNTKNGSQSRTRTCNLAINSRLLCQLSYLGMKRGA